jgi:hypothetical protein
METNDQPNEDGFELWYLENSAAIEAFMGFTPDRKSLKEKARGIYAMKLQVGAPDPTEILLAQVEGLAEGITYYNEVSDDEFMIGQNYETLVRLMDFSEEFNQFQDGFTKFMTSRLNSITNNMIRDLYSDGMFIDGQHDAEMGIQNSIGPNGYEYMKKIESRMSDDILVEPLLKDEWGDFGKSIRRRKRSNAPLDKLILNEDTHVNRAHLGNVLILHFLQKIDKKLFSQKRISELTQHSQSKISLDLFMARQLLQEAWVEELLDQTPDIEIVKGPFGAKVLQPKDAQKYLKDNYPDSQSWSTNVFPTSLEDRYDRWERLGFGYCLIENRATSKRAILTLTIVNSLNFNDLAEVVNTAKHSMLLYAERATTELASSFDDTKDIFSLPLVHLISTGNYSESRLIYQNTLSDLVLKGRDQYPHADALEKYLPLQDWLKNGPPSWQVYENEKFWTEYLANGFYQPPGHETAIDIWDYYSSQGSDKPY